MSNISSEEITNIVKTLKKLSPGELPFDIFHQFARLYVTSIVEIVPFKKHNDGKITTILLQRDKNDPA